MTRVKSGGDDDVAAFLQVCPQEDTAGVDVNGAGHLLLQGVHPVVPVQLHLGRDHSGTVSRMTVTDNILVSTLGSQTARTDPTVLEELELREPAKQSQLGWMENKCGHCLSQLCWFRDSLSLASQLDTGGPASNTRISLMDFNIWR